ncbi:Uncharacterised protein [uncultured archaeon]|nr:Uncharacterised protein [uncultured archaeon]
MFYICDFCNSIICFLVTDPVVNRRGITARVHGSFYRWFVILDFANRKGAQKERPNKIYNG